MKLPKFIKSFIDALKGGGDPDAHSLKKLLSVAFFWLIAYVTVKYTDSNNLVMVITIHTATLTALMGISTYHEIKTKGPDDTSTTDTTVTDKTPQNDNKQ